MNILTKISYSLRRDYKFFKWRFYTIKDQSKHFFIIINTGPYLKAESIYYMKIFRIEMLHFFHCDIVLLDTTYRIFVSGFFKSLKTLLKISFITKVICFKF